MSTSRTTTTTISPPRASTSAHPADPPNPDVPADEDEDSIMREALARVERVKARKAEEARKQAEEEEAARKAAEESERQKRAAAAQDARDRAIRAQVQENEVVERQRRLAEAATTRSRRDTSTGGTSISPRRPIVEVARMKSKGKGKASAQPVGEDPGDDDEDNEEREPCERCKVKKIPCLEQAGKRSSVICKPCHDSK
ncbi:hypothetical protein EV368DRAFT_70576, partial [Lentinula lateritia]